MCVCLGTNTWAKIQQWHVLFSFLEGFLWAEIKQMWDSGFEDYIDDWWNLMDFIMNSLYLATISLKIVAYIKVIYIKGFYLSVCFIYYFVLEQPSCRKNWHCVLSILSMFDYCSFFFQQYSAKCQLRDTWETWHPTLVAEALFSIANIFSSLRLISLFTANSHLGPLQISLGRMLLDILKFLFIYCLVLLAFANGLNQLYFYYETNNGTCKGIRCNQQNNAFSTQVEILT